MDHEVESSGTAASPEVEFVRLPQGTEGRWQFPGGAFQLSAALRARLTDGPSARCRKARLIGEAWAMLRAGRLRLHDWLPLCVGGALVETKRAMESAVYEEVLSHGFEPRWPGLARAVAKGLVAGDPWDTAIAPVSEALRVTDEVSWCIAHWRADFGLSTSRPGAAAWLSGAMTAREASSGAPTQPSRVLVLRVSTPPAEGIRPFVLIYRARQPDEGGLVVVEG